MDINLAVTPIAFLIFTVLAYVLFGIGKQMAVPFEKTEGKIAPYLCGEDLDLGVLSPGYWQFFSIAILFTILHVTVFMLALMPSPAVLFAVAYLAIVAAAVGVLIGEVRLTIPPREKAVAKLKTRAKIVEVSSGMPVGNGNSISASD
jgi:NADH:ubiquinone oxidoreductase subunit 3 (subunit A)